MEMSELLTLLTEIVPIAIVAALSPTTFAVMVLLLSLSKRPKTSGFSFFAGSLIVIITAVLLGFLAAEETSLVTGGNPTLFQGWINIILGIILVFFGIITSIKKDNPITQENFQEYSSRNSEFFGSMLLAVGIFALNLITTILVLFASSQIAISSVSWSVKIISSIILVIITLSLVEICLLTCLLAPQKADDILSKLTVGSKETAIT